MARSRLDPLARYRDKRNFDLTAEPSGAVAPDPTGPPRFVVQRHRARRLHYDLRLELDGVLVSWAVPKGPTLDPASRRLAVHVEDHPVDYFDFEGVIPAGEYGGGDVIVWDWGTWVPADGKNPAAGLRSGDLHVDLFGEKLTGRFALVRKGNRAEKDQWLLVHKHDDRAVDGWDPEQYPRSVRSGLTNDEVAALGSTPPPATWSDPTVDELAELEQMGESGVWSIGGDDVKLTHLDKELFPATDGEAAVTKRDLVRYWAQMAPFALPYLYDRPVNLHRYPDGAQAQGFWFKARPKGAPAWLQAWEYADAKPGKTETYSIVDRPAALVYMANLGALELHPWTSTAKHPHEPTWALIDIDPGDETSWDETMALARLHRTALQHLGVSAAAKVTGKRGIQIWVPVRQGLTFEDTASWVEVISKAIGSTAPDLVSWAWRVEERNGLARLDHTQNAINKTLVAPFCPRPAAGAPVSIPITMEELDDPDLRPDRWNVWTAFDRVHSYGDPLRRLIGLQQELPTLD